jgi:hypothetical protein
LCGMEGSALLALGNQVACAPVLTGKARRKAQVEGLGV